MEKITEELKEFWEGQTKTMKLMDEMGSLMKENLEWERQMKGFVVYMNERLMEMEDIMKIAGLKFNTPLSEENIKRVIEDIQENFGDEEAEKWIEIAKRVAIEEGEKAPK